MGHRVTTAELTRQLASGHRVVMLGGLAVIAHGHSRPTFDADAWLDPELPTEEWVSIVLQMLSRNEGLRAISIGDWAEIPEESFAETIVGDGVIRIMGASQPLDIFRAPNELDVAEFDAVWERGRALEDGTRVPDVIDLLVTKQATGRDKDRQDIAFLEAKAEREYLERLPRASAGEAAAMLERFLTPAVAEAAILHASASVRALGEAFLQESADEGDPFARDILRKHRALPED